MKYDLSELKKYSSIPPRGDKPFGEYLNGVINEYVASQLVHYKTGVLTSKDYKQIIDLCSRIRGVVDYGMKGLPYLAVTLFSEKANFSFATHKYLQGESFYRMRVVEDKRSLEVGELFHIPFSKQGKVETQRYSVSGLPCLYLGNSLYGCWEEMKRPTLQSCMFSRCESTKEFSCIDLVIPDALDSDEELRNLLVTIPLIIACSVKVGKEHEDDVFKPEYIMPQTLLQIVSMNDEGNKQMNRTDGIIGIRYKSVCQNIEFGFPEDKFDNVVIPAKFNGLEYDQRLCELFKITKPTCEEFERIRQRDITFDGGSAIDTRTADDLYKESLFGCLEGYIKDISTFPLQEVHNNK